MLKREKPRMYQILWQQLLETLQIKPYNSKTTEPHLVRVTARTYPVTEQR